MPEPSQPTLVRAIGRWSLAALTINCIIGSGVFGLPSQISNALGKASPLAWIFAAGAAGLVMACFAEVASRFDQSGGIYLYSRVAFGRTAGIAIAWLGCAARVTAAAANANLFVKYLAQFWPAIESPAPRALVLSVLLGVLTAVNYFGVRKGTLQSNIFTAAKLLTLGLFIATGLAFLAHQHFPIALAVPTGPISKWRDPLLVLMFAYGGYETALMPGAEARDPRRDYPFALFVALIVCASIYTLTQLIVVSVLPLATVTDRPMALAMQALIGPWGAVVVSIGVLVSCYGYLSANILGFPRVLFAMAENGDMPAAMAKVHPRFRTPHIAIVVFAILLFGFSLAKDFRWNLVFSAITRLFYYGSVCAALLVLRRKSGVPEARFRLPLGGVFASLAIAVSLLLLPKLDRASGIVLAIVGVCVIANSVWAARRRHLK
jgi:APA family basic amino acid/polyamine antiporter